MERMCVRGRVCGYEREGHSGEDVCERGRDIVERMCERGRESVRREGECV